MRGWSSILIGTLLLALAAWAYVTDFYSAAAIPLGLAGAFLIFRGLQGVEVTEAGDPTALGDFIANPAGALVDAAAEKAEERLTAKRKAAIDAAREEPAFDVDAALARYMANRPQHLLAVEDPQPARGFGRKGL